MQRGPTLTQSREESRTHDNHYQSRSLTKRTASWQREARFKRTGTAEELVSTHAAREPGTSRPWAHRPDTLDPVFTCLRPSKMPQTPPLCLNVLTAYKFCFCRWFVLNKQKQTPKTNKQKRLKNLTLPLVYKSYFIHKILIIAFIVELIRSFPICRIPHMLWFSSFQPRSII